MHSVMHNTHAQNAQNVQENFHVFVQTYENTVAVYSHFTIWLCL